MSYKAHLPNDGDLPQSDSTKVTAGVEHSFPISSLGLASGVYYVRLEGETFTRSMPITIVR
jgi:hypothetical protein